MSFSFGLTYTARDIFAYCFCDGMASEGVRGFLGDGGDMTSVRILMGGGSEIGGKAIIGETVLVMMRCGMRGNEKTATRNDGRRRWQSVRGCGGSGGVKG